jgi:hypothetical protein
LDCRSEQYSTDVTEEVIFGGRESGRTVERQGLKLDSTEEEVAGEETGGSNANSSTLSPPETYELKSDTKNN